jgi:predicted nucleic acid-binding protein
MHVDEVPERIVVDASLGLKWVLQEEHSDRAVALGPGRELLTSALFWAESGNAIATRVRRGDLDRASGNEALRDLQDVRLTTRPLDSAAVISALAIAHDLAHPIYDCCYLALAIKEDAIVVTADRRFRSAVAAHPSLADRVVLLRDIVLR